MTYFRKRIGEKGVEKLFEVSVKLHGKEAKAVLVDEGYRGRATIGNTKVPRVHQKAIKGMSRCQKKHRFRRRSAVEPIIGHLKSDYRLGRNFLKGVIGDSINLMLSCAAFNFKKLINQLTFAFIQLFQAPIRVLTGRFCNIEAILGLYSTSILKS